MLMQSHHPRCQAHLGQDLVAQRGGPLQDADLGWQACSPNQALQEGIQRRYGSWGAASSSCLCTQCPPNHRDMLSDRRAFMYSEVPSSNRGWAALKDRRACFATQALQAS